MDTRFAISEYNDAVAVNKELDELIKKPIYTIKPEALKKYEGLRKLGRYSRGAFSITLLSTIPSRLFSQRQRVHISMTLTATSILISFRQAARLFSAPTRKLFVSRSSTSLILAVPQPDFSTSLSTSSPKRFQTALKPLICSV